MPRSAPKYVKATTFLPLGDPGHLHGASPHRPVGLNLGIVGVTLPLQHVRAGDKLKSSSTATSATTRGCGADELLSP